MLTSPTVDEVLLPSNMNSLINFSGVPFNYEMVPSLLKHLKSVLSKLTLRQMRFAAFFKLCCRILSLIRCFCKKRLIIHVVCTGNSGAWYRLLLVFFTLRPFSFIWSLDVCSTWYRQIMNRYGLNVISLKDSISNIKMVSVPIIIANRGLHTFFKIYYRCDCLFWKTVC